MSPEPPAAAAVPPFSRVNRVARTGSTNSDVAHALRSDPQGAATWPHLSVLVADHQAAGRGRAGRGWETPPGTSLTATVVLRPAAPVGRWVWLSLLGGLAVARAVQARTGLTTGLKWPNDVLVMGAGERSVPGWGRDRKVAGVLAELVHPGGLPAIARTVSSPAALLGLGVNVEQAPADLPVPWATSLAACGVAAPARDRDALLTAVGAELVTLLAAWESADGEAVTSGLAGAVTAACTTLGRDVRVQLPGGAEVVGRARRLAADGALVLAPAVGPEVHVTAGDVDHIRTVSD